MGVVEFVFALVPAARSQGLGRLTVAAATELIRSIGGTVARAECEVDNLAARHSLQAAGFVETTRTPDLVVLELRL
ncbi:GNAT family N-acetyltransferase [Agromyces sp. MMS24-JH15]|uniref:GNAT family N-acetyltransferase n=1 Tax=Agromyces sp. MMS24-JH15 TaxID=3243765 RepID=UPI0037493D84